MPKLLMLLHRDYQFGEVIEDSFANFVSISLA
jgi:hypothetical protein